MSTINVKERIEEREKKKWLIKHDDSRSKNKRHKLITDGVQSMVHKFSTT